MNSDWLLELLGIKPRDAGATVGASVGQRGAVDGNPGLYQADPAAPNRNPTATLPPPPVDQPSDLMSILRRQQTNPTPNPQIDSMLAPQAQAAQGQAAEIEAERKRLADLEAAMQQEAERQQMQANLNPPRGAPAAQPRPQVAGGSMPAAPLRAPQPGDPGNPLAQPMNPAYAALERAGPPFVDASAPAPQPIPARPAPQAPVVPINQPAPATPGPMAAAPMQPQITTQGPFITMDPGNPFAEYMPPNVMPANGNPPPPSDPSARLQRPALIPPFTEPSAVMQLATGQREGMPIIGQPPAVPQPPEPFAPDGQIINWWNSGRGPTPNPAPAARPTAPRTAPTPAPGPDQSTLLNQAELQRFLTANGGNPTPPPAPATTPTPIVTSNPPPAPVAPAPGATPMTPAAPPSPGSQIPPALQEQLLSEAYRLVAQRNQQPALGPR